MKITLIGPTAGSMLGMAIALRAAGFKATYIQDRADRYPMHHPAWFSRNILTPFDDVDAALRWSIRQWREWERKVGWRRPDWVVDTLVSDRGLLPFGNEGTPIVQDDKILTELSSSDFVFANGVRGTTLANAGTFRKPFALWPHGSDIRMASGLEMRRSLGLMDSIRITTEVRQLRRAYRDASWLGTHDPTGLGLHMGSTGKLGESLRWMPFPILTLPRRNLDARVAARRDLFARLGLRAPDCDIIGFVPSRVHFYWKGQDRMIEALRDGRNANIGFVFSGWGQDYAELRDRVIKMGLENRVLFLPFVMSRPVLGEFLSCMDFAVDQFMGGTHGTAALEAMGAGCPVMMYINDDQFRSKGWEPPPVINASTTEEIGLRLDEISSGGIDLEAAGKRQQDFIKKRHSVAEFVRLFTDYTRQYAGIDLKPSMADAA